MDPRYALCRGGPHDNERWPLSGHVAPGDTFAWEDSDPEHPLAVYAVVAEIVQTNAGPMWVATPTAA